jgi:DNA-binding Xre family transcriptional regulator
MADDREKRRSEVLNEVSELFLDEMERQGVSSLELAMISGNSPSTVLRMKKGQNIQIYTLADLAGALGCRIAFSLVPEEAPNAV